MRVRRGGFTLIELMLVVAIIGILSAIAIPKFADLIRKSQEGGDKGNLGALRSALNIYYSENEGEYPTAAYGTNSSVLSDALVPKYIAAIPTLRLHGHADMNRVFNHWQISALDQHDGYGWIYDGTQPPDSQFGTVWVSCTHTDTKGSRWSEY